MSVTQSMEDVNRFVPMPLVALPAAVGQGTCWMEMALTAQVMLSMVSMILFFCTTVKDLLCSVQISMNVRVMTSITVMRMHSVLTQRGVSPAPAILATLEMESTAQVRYCVTFSRMERNITYVQCMSCASIDCILNTRYVDHLNPFCRYE